MGRKFLRQIIEVDCALAVTYLTGRWVIHYAYLERGYQAIGGECCLILIAYWAAWKALHYLFDVLEKLEYE